MLNSRLVNLSIKLCKGIPYNCPLFKAAKEFYIFALEINHTDWLLGNKTDEAFLENFEYAFPPGSIRRDMVSAQNIIYDLFDIAKSNVVRQELSPIHTYVLFHIMQNAYDLFEEGYIAFCDSESYKEACQFLKDSQVDSEIYNYCTTWFSHRDTFEWDFEECYNTDYVNYSFAEELAEIYLHDQYSHVKLKLIGVEISEFFDLLPNDLRTLCMKKHQTIENTKEYDFFISHASEDKTNIAIPLAEELIRRNAKVWLDKFELQIGSSLMESINEGLINSKKGIVIMSPIYFDKFWTKKELNSLFQKSQNGTNVILPIRHKITAEEIASKNILLSDIFSLSTDDYTISELADKLIATL